MRKTICLLAALLWFQNVAEAGELLYSRLTDGYWQIWKKDEGGQSAQLTTSLYDKRYPSVTKNGELVYQTNNNACFRITKEGKEEELLKDLWPIRDLVSSPSGSLFVFSRFRTDVVDQSNLWLFDPATNARTMLTRDPGVQYQPSWSWDGKRLAYTAGAGPHSKEIFVIEADGSAKRQLTDDQSNDLTPAWSPEGARIVFSSGRTGDYEIWIMNADGTDPKQLTDSPGLDTRPVFSPDGSQIAFTSNRSGQLEIWAMNADGSNPRPWLNEKAETCDPFWF